MNLIGLIISYMAIVAVLLLARFFERFGKEVSRKFIHIAVCNWWLIGMAFFTSPLWAAVVPASFVAVNFFCCKYALFSSLRREKGESGVGAVCYAASLLALAFLALGRGPEAAAAGGAGAFAMGYGDGLAAIIGRAVRSPRYVLFGAEKSVGGNLAVLACSFLPVFLLLTAVGIPNAAAVAAAVGVVAMVLEAVTPLGLDNLTVPLISAGVAALLI